MNTEVELKLKQYKERFGEPLTKTHIQVVCQMMR